MNKKSKLTAKQWREAAERWKRKWLAASKKLAAAEARRSSHYAFDVREERLK